MPENDCWHQKRHEELATARRRVAAMDARLQRCRDRLAASDEAMRRGDYAEMVRILEEELNDREPHLEGNQA